jgi:hypothetical protein
MMSDRKPVRRHVAMWILAPLSAGVFGVSTSWAIQHDPLAKTAASAPAPSPIPQAPRLRALEIRLDAATAQYNATRRALLAVEDSLRRGDIRLAGLRRVPTSGTVSSGASVGQASPPAGTPHAAALGTAAPPPVNTTTGAS